MPLAPSAKAMVPFVSVANMMSLIHGVGVETVLSELTECIRSEFARWPNFEKTPRLASHSANGVIELMPACDGSSFAFKYVNGHPRNTAEGLQTVAAFGLLADVETGYPTLIAEMTLLTALRTAATSALAATVLAPPGASTMAIIGNGAQAEFQALAMKAVLGISHVKLFDIDPLATDKVARNLKSSGLKLTICSTAESAVEDAQIITTATADKQLATILVDNMVGAGVHINAIGGDCPGKTELHPDILRRADTFVEYEPQTRIEGEIQQMESSYPVTELWRVLTGDSPGRTNSRQITLFDSVGFAIEDFAALKYVREKIGISSLSSDLDLIADPDDPRDLYGMLLRAA
jgi:ornithine cyclodeaminase